jgi:hypothetical protein
VDFDQTDELPQERKREYFEVQPYHIKAGLEIWREIKKQYNVYKRYQQTGVYIKLPTKENEKIKEPEIREMIPILSLAPIPSKIPPLSPQTKNESKKEPHSNSDSENSKKSSNDEVNTNKDQTPSKKTNSDA